MSKRSHRTRRKRRKDIKPARQESLDLSESIQIGREYLTSRQKAYGALPSFDMAKIRVLLRNATKDLDLDDAVQAFLQLWVDTAEKMSEPVPGLPYQDSPTHKLLIGLLRRVEASCAKLNINRLGGTVVGTLLERSVNAFNASFFGSTSLIVINRTTLVFVWLLAKCVLPVIAAPGRDGELCLGKRPSPEQASEALERMRELVLAMRLHRDPTCAPAYLQPPNWVFAPFVSACAHCIELFIFAHEYGHIVIERSDGSFPKLPFKSTSSHGIESLADFYAYLILIGDADKRSPELWALSPLIFFKFLALMERDGVMPTPVEHPSSGERLSLLIRVFDALSSDTDPVTGARVLLNVWNSIDELMDAAWAAVDQNRVGLDSG